MSVRTRFAPSPSGRLHLGNLRTAVLCWLYARQHGGQFLLRLDDTDASRSRAEHVEAIEADLRWLGLEYDERFCQSERLARYEEVFAELKSAGHIYACYETPEELALKRTQQLARGRPPRYDRAALKLTEADKARHEQEGRRPHWRLRLSGARAEWQDMVRGPQKVATMSLSDPVVRRADGAFLYTLPSAVDDVDYRISHIIRGEDHVTNTAVQLELLRCLNARPPHFGHHPLVVEADGSALSKRNKARGLDALAEAGYQPRALRAYLAQLGQSQPAAGDGDAGEEPPLQLEAMGRSALRFSDADLKRLNARYLRAMAYQEVQPLLQERGCDGGEAFWLAMRGNISLLADLPPFYAMLTQRPALELASEDRTFLSEAADLLPPEPWDEGSWQTWVDALKAATPRKGAALFQPLRLALTGLAHGPEMRVLLPLLGRERATERLRATQKKIKFIIRTSFVVQEDDARVVQKDDANLMGRLKKT